MDSKRKQRDRYSASTTHSTCPLAFSVLVGTVLANTAEAYTVTSYFKSIDISQPTIEVGIAGGNVIYSLTLLANKMVVIVAVMVIMHRTVEAADIQ